MDLIAKIVAGMIMGTFLSSMLLYSLYRIKDLESLDDASLGDLFGIIVPLGIAMLIMVAYG